MASRAARRRTAGKAEIRPPQEDYVIDKPKKTNQARKMLASVTNSANGAAGSKPRLGAKGPAGNLSEGGKKVGRGAAGASGKSLGMPSTKAKRPGGK